MTPAGTAGLSAGRPRLRAPPPVVPMSSALHRCAGVLLAGLALAAPRPAAAQPAWSVTSGPFAHRMDVHVAVYDADRRVGGAGDRVAAFVGGEVRGVADAVVGADGAVRFALTAFTNRTADTLTFRWYDAAAGRVVVAENRVRFVSGGIVGRPEALRRLYVQGSEGVRFDPDAWTVDPARFAASMQVAATVLVGTRPSGDTRDRLAAFVGGEVRGVATPVLQGGRHVFYLTVHGAPTDGPVAFSFADAATGAAYRVEETFAFAEDTAVGTAASPVPLHVRPGGVTVAPLRVLLQGPYGGGAMTTALNAAGLVPRAHPYGPAPFGHAGPEAVTAAFLAAHPDVVDWVLVRLRRADDPAVVVASAAAFVTADGTVIGPEGDAGVAFGAAPPGRYFVSVHHRNHLAAMTSAALDCTGGACAFSFATGAAHGVDAQAPLGGGLSGLWAGDADGDGAVIAPDYQGPWRSGNGGPTGYHPADFDLDGAVIAPDYQGFWRPNNSRESRVPGR